MAERLAKAGEQPGQPELKGYPKLSIGGISSAG